MSTANGRIQQLESHLSYRIGLKTFPAVESRSVIGIPDAYELPTVPAETVDHLDDPEIQPCTVMHTVIEQLMDGAPAHQVWLPPLTALPTLDQLLPPLVPDPVHGLGPSGAAGRGLLTVPLGLVDRPFEQTRDLLTASLSDSGGHVGIAGGPRSGKSTLLCTRRGARLLQTGYVPVQPNPAA